MYDLCIMLLQPRRKPHPPTSGRASRGSSRLRHIPSSTSYSFGPALNRNLCLPPVGHSLGGHSLAFKHSLLKERMQRLSGEEESENTTTAAAASFESTLQALQAVAGDKTVSDDEEIAEGPSIEDINTPSPKRQLESLEKLSQALTSVIEDDSEKTETVLEQSGSKISRNDLTSDLTINSSDLKHSDKPKTDIEVANCDSGSISVTPSVKKKDLLHYSSLGAEASSSSRPVTSSKIKDVTLENLRESLKPPSSSKGKSKVKGDLFLESLRETLGQSSSLSRHSSLDKRKEFTLESLSTSEARAMSGLLRQASLEKVGSSRIGNVTVTSASRNRVTGNYTLGNSTFQDGRITTPEGRLVVSYSCLNSVIICA